MHALIVLTAVLSTLAAEPAPTAAPLAMEPSAAASAPAAAAAAPPEPAPAPPEATSAGPADTLQLAQAARDRQRAEQESGGRVLLESLAGLGLSVGGLTLYGANGGLTASGPEAVLIPMSILTLGSGMGVSLAGWMFNRGGNPGLAILGGALGVVVPLTLGWAAVMGGACGRAPLNQCQTVQTVGIGMLVLPTIGAIIGYELSAPKTQATVAPAAAHASDRWWDARQIVPVLAPTREGVGAMVGIAGTL
jgi:hypothetical protein